MKRAKLIFSAISIAMAVQLSAIDSHASELATGVAASHTFDNLRQFEGSVEAVNKSTISAQTAGRIKTINFDVDDFVKAGSVIVTFYDTEHKSRLKQAESALMAATAQRVSAQQDFNRTAKLFAKGTVAKSRYDTAKSSIDSAKAREESAKAAVQQAKEQLDYTVVRAPYSGFVVERHIQIGEIANPGKPLMTGFSLEKLRVKAEVPQQFAAAIRKGGQAIIYGPNKVVIQSSDLTVFPFADPKSNTVTIRIALPEGTKSVFPGMLVKTAFKVGQSTNISIPLSAVVHRGELVGVYIIDKNEKIQLQQIRIGRKHGKDRVEVLAGLKDGDKLALDPLMASIKLKSEMAAEK
jgi:RND family efflux transporter MFP subunit